MKVTTIIHPRYVETDQMGVIHHSIYPVWYEVGRVQFCDVMGYPFSKIEKDLSLAVLKVTSVYKATARFGDQLVLTTQIKSYSKVKIEFEYEIINQEGLIINYGTTEHCWLNKNFKPVNIAKINPTLYNLITKATLE